MIKQTISILILLAITTALFEPVSKSHTCVRNKVLSPCSFDRNGDNEDSCLGCSVKQELQVVMEPQRNHSEVVDCVELEAMGWKKLWLFTGSFFGGVRPYLWLPPRASLSVLYCVYRT